MYKFADVTYPLLVATQADYSLFYATGVVTFRFEFIDPKSRLVPRDLFRFTALYKSRDRSYLSDSLVFTTTKASVERVIAHGRMSVIYPRTSRVSSRSVLNVNATYRQQSRAVASDYFKFGQCSTRQLHHTVAVDSFFIKNPHSRSFLLGDTSPENTALGGQGYA